MIKEQKMKNKTNYKISQRIERYYQLNSVISSLSNKQLKRLFKASEQTNGWGKNHQLTIQEQAVFVKRVPLTMLEYNKAFSTKNIFKLPSYYNYGVGSAGFGVFRELLTHIKTSNWVLNKEITNFPLLYHYRIMKVDNWKKSTQKVDEKYIAYWNGNKNIEKYIKARKNAKYELVLFLEHFPYTLSDWFGKNTHKAVTLLQNMKNVSTFLHQKGIIHLDAHFRNLLSDGEQLYLTDFGLSLDKNFELSKKECAFYKQHKNYDLAEYLCSMTGQLVKMYHALPTKKQAKFKQFGLEPNLDYHKQLKILTKNIEAIYKQHLLNIHNDLCQIIKKEKATILYFNKFTFALRTNNKKDNKFDGKKVKN